MENDNKIEPTKTGRPVESFPIQYTWQTGEWEQLFDKQIGLIKEDIHRAKMQGKMIIYLSCPISSRGGGYSGTNVEIADFTKMRLTKEWGTGFWILNPASYQMESKGGTGLMYRHATELWGEKKGKEIVDRLMADEKTRPQGGDYMRMWTQVLVTDSMNENSKDSGYDFDGYYFLGPSDVKAYFLNSDDGDLTSSIHNYFSRKFSLDSDFRDYYSIKGLTWGSEYKDGKPQPINRSKEEIVLREIWEKKRIEFFRFYSLKAGINFSSGSHDEWNTWYEINRKRIATLERKEALGNLMPAFFEGKQITPSDFITRADEGYEV